MWSSRQGTKGKSSPQDALESYSVSSSLPRVQFGGSLAGNDSSNASSTLNSSSSSGLGEPLSFSSADSAPIDQHRPPSRPTQASIQSKSASGGKPDQARTAYQVSKLLTGQRRGKASLSQPCHALSQQFDLVPYNTRGMCISEKKLANKSGAEPTGFLADCRHLAAALSSNERFPQMICLLKLNPIRIIFYPPALNEQSNDYSPG